MPGLEGLIQDQKLSPFKQRGWGAAREAISGITQAYAATQSPEFILKRTTADILTGKKKVSDLDPAVRKLMGLQETKEQMLLKQYLEGDRSPEVLEGLGMRVTKTLKEQAIEAISLGTNLPGMSQEETKKAAGVYIPRDDITPKELETLGSIELATGKRGFRGWLADVLTPGATPREKAVKKYRGVPEDVLKKFKEQVRRKTAPKGSIRVRRKSDGTVGSIPIAEFDPAIYEKE